jgi:hypothetical protein
MCSRSATCIRCRAMPWILPLLLLMLMLPPSMVHANVPVNPDFARTWAREDGPVAAGAAARTWLWGPEAFTSEMTEPYASGERAVIYFDKARMEINDPGAERGRWYVTTGLLATEMMTGNLQTSHSTFEQRGPALIPVAGDPDDPDGPTYASFDHVRNVEPFNTGTTLTATIGRDGTVGHDQHFARYAVLAEHYVPTTRHAVASVFWEYLNTSGTVEDDGVFTTGRLFEPWFYATGLPLTEAYWSRVMVGGSEKDVLIQIFERRVLTYTPSNDPGWRVELGNVGRHYYFWRYERDGLVSGEPGQLSWSPDLAALPDVASDADGWSMYWDTQSDSYVVESQPFEGSGVLRLLSRYWEGSPVGPLDDYRVTVDLHISGAGEGGLGVLVAADDTGIASMVYFGVDTDGVRRLTYEDNVAATSRDLLRPASGIAGWNAQPAGWNTLTMTVGGGRAFIQVGSSVVAEVEVPHTAAEAAGLALVVGHSGGDDSSLVVRFRNLQIQSVEVRSLSLQ